MNEFVSDHELMSRSVWIKTFGCQMNYHDSERILHHLAQIGFRQTQLLEEADLILFNTCAIRALANNKFYSQLGEIKKIKQGNPQLKVGICGCVSQIEGDKLLKKYKQIDFAFGTDCVDQLPEMIFRLQNQERGFFVNTWDQAGNYSIETKIMHNTPQAFVNIMKGCNNFCSYCIVPYTRGREVSRKLDEIVHDVRNLTEIQGIREVTLLGQNVNSFGSENGDNFVTLLRELHKIDKLKLLRYTTSHPKDLSSALIQAHGELPKLANHLHLPVQSGSNDILKSMNRHYTREHYLSLLGKLREANPSIVISSDIIVGFPGETEKDFEDTMALLEEAQFDFIFSFCFSSRPGTKAAKMIDHLDAKEKSLRLRRLQLRQLEIQKTLRASMIGKTMRILVDQRSQMNGSWKWQGRTSCNRIVHFAPVTYSDDLMWNWVDVRILEATALSAQAEFIQTYGRL